MGYAEEPYPQAFRFWISDSDTLSNNHEGTQETQHRPTHSSPLQVLYSEGSLLNYFILTLPDKDKQK